MGFLSDEELSQLTGAETLFPSPIPVQFVSSDEFMPGAQTSQQREFETRVKQIGAKLAKHHGMSRRKFFKTVRRNGGRVRGDERDLREGRGADLCGGEGRGDRPPARAGARRFAEEPVRDGHAHALPARGHADQGVRRAARGGRQGGLEPGAGRQAADHRRPDVPELLQGDLPRQRHQGRVHQRLLLGGPEVLLPHQRDEVRRAREGQQGGRHPAHVLARDLHARPGRLARRGSTRRTRSSSPTRGRATRSATTPTSTCRSGRSGSTTRS